MRPPTVGLAHELGHAEDLVNGKALEYDREAARNGTDPQDVIKGNQNEKNAIDKENAVRKVLKLETRSYDYYPRK